MDYEKKLGEKSSSNSDVGRDFYDETLQEPPADETLHRGLKARQISMIAVRGSEQLGRTRLKGITAWRCCRDRSYYWIRNCTQKRRAPWYHHSCRETFRELTYLSQVSCWAIRLWGLFVIL